MSTPAITGVHPYADKFPMLPEPELQELAESILQNDLRQPIVLTEDGLILDGRNRAKACEMAGVTPDTVVYDGDDLAEYVIDCNVTRRNMSTGARAMSTALVLVEDGNRENGRWQHGSAEKYASVQVTGWRQRVYEAGIVIDYKPGLADQVITGALELKVAFQQADSIRRSADADKIRAKELEKQRRQEEESEANRQADAKGELAEAGADHYLTMIEDGMKPTSALAAWREDTRKEREREAAERRNDEQQAREWSKALHTLHAAAHPAQREWTRRAIEKYPDAVPDLYLDAYTPATIRETADGLRVLADEMETSNA